MYGTTVQIVYRIVVGIAQEATDRAPLPAPFRIASGTTDEGLPGIPRRMAVQTPRQTASAIVRQTKDQGLSWTVPETACGTTSLTSLYAVLSTIR